MNKHDEGKNFNSPEEVMSYFTKLNNAELKEVLKSTKVYKDEDLNDIVTLVRRISTDKGKFELLREFNTDKAIVIDPVCFLMQLPFLQDLNFCIKNNIKGVDLYVLWTDCAKKDPKKFLLNLWALESGVYKKNEIDENFKINHLNFGSGGQDDMNWLYKTQRVSVLPFVFDENLVNPKDYMSRPETVTSPHDAGFKKYIQANRTLQRFMMFIYSSGLVKQKIQSVSPTDIEVTMIMPTENLKRYRDSINGDYFYFSHGFVQDENNKPDTFVINIAQVAEIVVDKNQKKHFDMIIKEDYSKILYFLKEAKRQFLPSLPVIRTFPISEVNKFFTNGNCKRFGDIMSKSGLTEYEEQEGLVKVCYMLGLFSDKGAESEIAETFINKHILGKVDGKTLHKLYGGIRFNDAYKKDFAKFFMIHYANDPHAFEDAKGTDFTSQIYNRFEDVLAFRAEKEISTSTDSKRLTPQMAIDVFSDVSFLYGIDPEKMEKIKDVKNFKESTKYIGSKNEMLWTIDLMKESYDLKNQKLNFVYIKDDSNSPCKFRIIEKGDAEITYTGKKTNCCFVYSGASHNSLEHAIRSKNSSVVVFEGEGAYAQGWFYYDAKNKLFFIDNIEGRPVKDENNKTANVFVDALIRFADKMFVALNNNGLPCKEVRIGKDAPFVVTEAYQKYLKNGDLIDTHVEQSKDEEFKLKYDEFELDYDEDSKLIGPNMDYINYYRLYSDADSQFIISNEELAKRRGAFASEEIKEVQNQPS